MIESYEWKSGARIELDPMQFGAYVSSLAERNDGAVTPEMLVEDARRPGSPLHAEIEWDDATAAEKHRLSQARYLLRSLVVTVRSEGDDSLRQVRAYWPVRQDGDRVYVSVTVVLADTDWRQETLERARQELAGWRRRYADLVELAELIEVIDEHLEPQPA